VVVALNPDVESRAEVGTVVKRVVGLPGETVGEQDGKLTINGKIVDEPYLGPGTVTEGVSRLTLGPGEFYLLGDQRENSLDSRYFDGVKRHLLERRVVEVVSPGNMHSLD
jgi:signal peptidase I